MEAYISISMLNDFIFCPKSIYYHGLYRSFAREIYQQKPQIDGLAAHQTIDERAYSTRKEVLQSLEIYSEKYKLCGKIDVFDYKTGRLTERKKNIVKIYDGYVLQVYAHYFCLIEMGYHVAEIVLHDLTKNKNYFIDLPENNVEMFILFEETINQMQNYKMNNNQFSQNPEKCFKCIYNNLCDYSPC